MTGKETRSVAEPSGIGDRIKKCLEDKGMSQRELAKKCRVTEASIARYIENARVPKAPILVAIAEALDVSPEYLMGGE